MAEQDSIAGRLDHGLAPLQLALDATQRQALLDYLALLVRWNGTYNLTAIRDPLEMVDKHLLDSLAVLPHVHPTSIADIGSGAGFPGVPLAIARPALRVVLIESNGKKARFLREVKRTLDLSQLEVFEGRAEAFEPGVAPDAAIARAVASLADLGRLAAVWLPLGGRFYAMKGPGFEAELGQLPPGYELEAVTQIIVPGLDAERVLVVLKRVQVPV